MLSEIEMKKCVGKNIFVEYVNGEKLKTYCEEFVQKEEENEEAMLFIIDNGAIMQSEIKSIKILDDEK